MVRASGGYSWLSTSRDPTQPLTFNSQKTELAKMGFIQNDSLHLDSCGIPVKSLVNIVSDRDSALIASAKLLCGPTLWQFCPNQTFINRSLRLIFNNISPNLSVPVNISIQFLHPNLIDTKTFFSHVIVRFCMFWHLTQVRVCCSKLIFRCWQHHSSEYRPFHVPSVRKAPHVCSRCWIASSLVFVIYRLSSVP
jgi:hypothetical protein